VKKKRGEHPGSPLEEDMRGELSMTEVLNESKNSRQVQVYRHADGVTAVYTLADMSETHVVLTKISNLRKPKHFMLTREEMDALVEAWNTYRGDLQVAETKEIIRIEGEIDQSYRLLEERCGEDLSWELSASQEDGSYALWFGGRLQWNHMDPQYVLGAVRNSLSLEGLYTFPH
jgi:hypothetical protein